MKLEEINIEDIEFKEELYPRNGLDPKTVNQYMLNLDDLPPIKVSQDLTLIDGHHRVTAFSNAGHEKIKAEIVECNGDILQIAAKENAMHGKQLTNDEKRYLAKIFYDGGDGLTQDKIGDILAVDQSTISTWLKEEADKARKERNKRIFSQWLSYKTQGEIANNFDLDRSRITQIVSNMKNNILEEPPEPQKIQRYNVWNIAKDDDEYGVNFEGRGPPGKAIENLLYYYTDPFDFVVDPMAGGGSTIDVCKEMKRKWRAYDINPVREDIEQNDLTKQWPKDAKNCDFIYLDPPYYKKVDYNEESLDTDSKEQFFGFLEKIAKNCYKGLKKGGIIAVVAADYISIWKEETPVLANEYAEIFNKKFKPISRISCPIPTQEWTATDVKRAKESKVILETARDIFIFKRC